MPACETWYAKLVAQCWSPEPSSRPSFETALAILSDEGRSEGVDLQAPVIAPIPITRKEDSTEQLLGPSPFSLSSSRQSVTVSSLTATKPTCRVIRRVTLPFGANALAATAATGPGSELIWAALTDGSLACISARGGAILNVLAPIRSCAATCLAKIAGKLWVGFQDGTVVSVTTASVVIDTLEPRLRVSVVALVASYCSVAPGLVVYADGTLSLLRADLSLHTSVAIKASVVSVCVNEDQSGLVLAFLGDVTGVITVVKLPELAVRGSFRASAAVSAIQSLVCVRNVLWAGLASGVLSLFRLGEGVSMLPGRQAHSSSVLACVPFDGLDRVLTLSNSAHLCWWEEETFDLEWEKTDLLNGSQVNAALNLLDKTLVLSEKEKDALVFVSVVHTTNSLSEVSGDVAQMMQGSDPETRLYVLVQQYRQCEGVGRRAIAQTIQVKKKCVFGIFFLSTCPTGSILFSIYFPNRFGETTGFFFLCEFYFLFFLFFTSFL